MNPDHILRFVKDAARPKDITEEQKKAIEAYLDRVGT